MNTLYMVEVVLGILTYAYSTLWFISELTKEIYTKEKYADKIDEKTNRNIVIGSVVISTFLVAFPLFVVASVINFIIGKLI